jgi:transcription elongation factor Elf1
MIRGDFPVDLFEGNLKRDIFDPNNWHCIKPGEILKQNRSDMKKLQCPNCKSDHVRITTDSLMEKTTISCVSCDYKGNFETFEFKNELDIEKEFNEWSSNFYGDNKYSACDAFIAGYELAKKMGER